jgi:hypothetical protein
MQILHLQRFMGTAILNGPKNCQQLYLLLLFHLPVHRKRSAACNKKEHQ